MGTKQRCWVEVVKIEEGGKGVTPVLQSHFCIAAKKRRKKSPFTVYKKKRKRMRIYSMDLEETP